ncbi:MAG: cytochrome ubiquinol oxidase subunit I [Bacillota bacterium]|nr:cytochrome ubiquinol oxidase subunit I [Bacillota bacterium]
MSDLLAARWQMGISLGWHMLFAAFGVTLPLLMVLAEGLGLLRRSPVHLQLARRWSGVTAVLFAVGAVSGTALSFELGLLWPRLMGFAGPVLGMAFFLEGFAFFAEAIFLGLYLYGWERLPAWGHWLSGLVVAVAGSASSVLVTAANAWMQVPYGARTAASDPLGAALGNPVWPRMAVHATLAAWTAAAYAVAGWTAWRLLREPEGPLRAERLAGLRLAMLVALVGAVAMPVSGDASARQVAVREPVKLAAMEAQFTTRAAAPLRIGGLPDPARRTVRWALEIPAGLSWLAFRRGDATVRGLDAVPPSRWPPVTVTHVSFQVMVGSSLLLVVAALLFWLRAARSRPPRWSLRLLVAASPFGFVALETGWFVTEFGRQPWAVAGLMSTADAVTTGGGISFSLLGFILFYAALSAAVVYFLRRLDSASPDPGEGPGDALREEPALPGVPQRAH